MGSKMHSNPEGINIRGKLVTNLEQVERRLGSLERLLQGSSECVAIVLLEDKLLIAENEIFKNSRSTNKVFFLK